MNVESISGLLDAVDPHRTARKMHGDAVIEAAVRELLSALHHADATLVERYYVHKEVLQAIAESRCEIPRDTQQRLFAIVDWMHTQLTMCLV